jgi:plasmid stabilization system protein ParE
LLDLVRLHEFLAPKSPPAAVRAVDTIRQHVRILATHPKIGRRVDELPEDFRELVIEFGHGGYVVRYSYDGVLVMVLAIRHGREAGY